MSVYAQSADGVLHEFPDGTDQSVIDQTMKAYAQRASASGSRVTAGMTLPWRGQQAGAMARHAPTPGAFDPSTAKPVSEFNPDRAVPVSEFDPSRAVPVTQAGKYLKPSTSFLLGLYKGATEPLDNAASALSWAAHRLPLPLANESVGDAVDHVGSLFGMPTAQQAALGHQNYVASREAAGVQPSALGEFAGNVIGTAPAALLTTNPFALGALTGALTTQDQTPAGIAKSAGIGAIAGKAGDATMGALSRAISPHISEAVSRLLGAGVKLTPGQILGGTAKRVEDAATSIPLVGDAIANARSRGLDSYNRAMVNHVLKPIGETLPADVPVGRDAIEYAGQKVSGAYNSLLPNLTVRVDPTFTGAVSNLRSLAQNLQPAQRQQFNNVLKSEVLDKFTGTGAMSGETLKDVETTLGQIVRRYGSHTASPADLDYRDAVRELQSQLRDLVARNNPAARAQLGAINKSYAGLLRLENAASRAGAENGVFTAPQFSAAVRAVDSSANKRAYARGNAMLQDMADAGKSVLPSKLPDSGTAKRVMTGAGLGLGAHLFAPALDPTLFGLAGATAGTWGAYSDPGLRALTYLLAKRPAGAQALSSAVRSLGTPAALGSAALASQQVHGP